MIEWLDKQGTCEGIKAERIRQELSYAELSRRSGVGASTISRIEKESCNPKTETLTALLRGLGSSEDVFGIEL